MVVVKIIAFYHDEKIVGLNMCVFLAVNKRRRRTLSFRAEKQRRHSIFVGWWFGWILSPHTTH
jgi:hypothetical protein